MPSRFDPFPEARGSTDDPSEASPTEEADERVALGERTGQEGHLLDGAHPAGTSLTFTADQRAGIDNWRSDQDSTLAAIHQLEAAVGLAAPGRQAAWRNDVLAALELLDQATCDEDQNAALPDSLLSDIARTQPRLRPRVRGLRTQYRHVRESIARLRRELVEADDDLDFADVRQRVAWLLNALRYQRARESDLIYEAYYEAFNRDVEEDLQTEGPAPNE